MTFTILTPSTLLISQCTKNDFFHILFCSFLYSDQQYQSSKLWRYNSWRLPFLWVLWHFIWTRSWKCSRMSRKMHFSKIVQKILQVFWIFWKQGTYILHIHCSITTYLLNYDIGTLFSFRRTSLQCTVLSHDGATDIYFKILLIC